MGLKIEIDSNSPTVVEESGYCCCCWGTEFPDFTPVETARFRCMTCSTLVTFLSLVTAVCSLFGLALAWPVLLASAVAFCLGVLAMSNLKADDPGGGGDRGFTKGVWCCCCTSLVNFFRALRLFSIFSLGGSLGASSVFIGRIILSLDDDCDSGGEVAVQKDLLHNHTNGTIATDQEVMGGVLSGWHIVCLVSVLALAICQVVWIPLLYALQLKVLRQRTQTQQEEADQLDRGQLATLRSPRRLGATAQTRTFSPPVSPIATPSSPGYQTSSPRVSPRDNGGSMETIKSVRQIVLFMAFVTISASFILLLCLWASSLLFLIFPATVGMGTGLMAVSRCVSVEATVAMELRCCCLQRRGVMLTMVGAFTFNTSLNLGSAVAIVVLFAQHHNTEQQQVGGVWSVVLAAVSLVATVVGTASSVGSIVSFYNLAAAMRVLMREDNHKTSSPTNSFSSFRAPTVVLGDEEEPSSLGNPLQTPSSPRREGRGEVLERGGPSEQQGGEEEFIITAAMSRHQDQQDSVGASWPMVSDNPIDSIKMPSSSQGGGGSSSAEGAPQDCWSYSGKMPAIPEPTESSRLTTAGGGRERAMSNVSSISDIVPLQRGEGGVCSSLLLAPQSGNGGGTQCTGSKNHLHLTVITGRTKRRSEAGESSSASLLAGSTGNKGTKTVGKAEGEEENEEFSPLPAEQASSAPIIQLESYFDDLSTTSAPPSVDGGRGVPRTLSVRSVPGDWSFSSQHPALINVPLQTSNNTEDSSEQEVSAAMVSGDEQLPEDPFQEE